MNNLSFLDDLNDKQREICTSNYNYVLTACPGSGKTKTITYRIAFLQEKYKESRKYNIAITYTNRAADEIDHRLEDMNIEMSSTWTGTIHQFCMQFIIRPYSMYSDYLRTGYKIIDEYAKDSYCKEIAKELNINYGYEDPLSFIAIKKEYYKRLHTNKEIDFDLILSLSLKLLIDKPFIAENISSLVRSIHIDEFQDTNEIQYRILAEIVKYNKNINVVFVGDINQAIFGSIGATQKSVDEIKALFGLNFKEETLSGCYRSTDRVINFYRNFEVNQTGAYSLSIEKNLNGIIKYDTNIQKNELISTIKTIIEEQLSRSIPENEICIVAPQWYQIFPIANGLKSALPALNFDAPDISAFKYDPLNPFYLLVKLLFTKAGKNVRVRKKWATEILNILKVDFQIHIEESFDNYSLLRIVNCCQPSTKDGMSFFKQSVYHVLSAMKINLKNEKSLNTLLEDFIKKANERIKQYNIESTYDAFCKSFKEKNGIVINTIHGVKGEEYNTVIAFGLLNGRLPHWDYIISNDKKPLREVETKRLLYVLSSRAKENLYLFSEKGCFTGKGTEYTPTDELRNVNFDYD